MKWNNALLALTFCVTLGWSGTESRVVGAPQKSQLVRDLRATRKGDKVTLTWSQPREAANQRSVVQHLAVARVCRRISTAAASTTSDSMAACTQTVGQIDLQKSAAISANVLRGKGNGQTVRFIDTLPEENGNSRPLQFAVYRVELRDGDGHRVGSSNAVSVPLAPLLPAEGLHSELDLRGVYLIWENEIESRSSPLKFDYRIYRSEKGSSHRTAIPYLRAVVHLKEGDRWSGVDTNIEWEKTYSYWVAPVTRVYSDGGELIGEMEGEDSPSIEVTTHDVFPPARPEGLLAVPGQILGKKFVDLIWAPNTEKDLAGYNVYRREEGGRMARINSAPPAMLSFQDIDVVAGRRYFYSVSAVDVRGNEGTKSPETTVVQP